MTFAADKQLLNARHSDEVAATRDDNPHWRLPTEAIARSIRDTVPLSSDWRMLASYATAAGTRHLIIATFTASLTTRHATSA